MYGATRLDDGLFQPLQVVIEMPQRAPLESLAGSAELLPVVELAGDFEAFVADRGGGLAQVPAQSGVSQRGARGLRKGGCTQPDQAVGGARHRVSPSVEARISARCRVRTPLRRRVRPPPMCMRQELSAAQRASAPVSRTARILSVRIAAEVSAFFIAKVPPKPQQASACGSSTRSMPRTARSNWRGLSPRRRTRRE